jgi:hypothetical protein
MRFGLNYMTEGYLEKRENHKTLKELFSMALLLLAKSSFPSGAN